MHRIDLLGDGIGDSLSSSRANFSFEAVAVSQLSVNMKEIIVKVSRNQHDIVLSNDQCGT